jgi:hypothetical protein
MLQGEEQGPLLESLIYLNQSKVIVEVGVAEAKSTHFLCEGAKAVGGFVYGYDLWDTHGLNNQFEHWSSKEKCETYLRSKGHVNFELTKINSKTPEFHELIKSKHPVIDLAFIDGCHSYEGILNDFNAIYPQLSETGVIVFHDTMSIDGCRELMIDLRTKFFDGTFDLITFPYGSMVYGDGNKVDRRTGISVLAKRGFATIPQACDEICNIDDHTQDIYVKEEEWYESELKKAKKVKTK